MKKIAQGEHTFVQRWLIDPVVGLLVGSVLFLFWMMPLPMARCVGRFLGKIVGKLNPKRNGWALFNLHIAFPKNTQAQNQKILTQMWAHFGQVAAELPHLKRVLRESKCHHIGYLKQAYQAGRGGFVCSAHFGNWEVPFGRQVAPDFVLNPVFRKANNVFLNWLLFHHRQGVKIPKGPSGARTMIDLLKKGKFISILCDQKFREGMTVPFYGMPAQTATAMTKLALKMNLPILMAKCVFQKDHYEIEIFKPLALPQASSREEAEYQLMLKINQIYEQWFRQNPEQVLWVHRRYNKHIYPKS